MPATTTEELARELLKLPASDRIKVLNQVIASLDADAERDAKWNAVAARRDAEANADPSSLVSGTEALARVRADVA